MKRNLLRLLLWVCCFLLLNIAHAQWVSIPDTAFGTWLNANYNGCMQGNNTIGWQMDTTCPAVVQDTFLNCYNSNIYDLTGIRYFDSLKWLECNHNHLTTLPVLPPVLKTLYCQHNQLTSLPASLGTLIFLTCDNNHITTIPPLPANFRSLECTNNQISSLPALPNGMIYLGCGSNQLTSLPTLPDSLNHLYCPINQLSSLPALPPVLNNLNCSSNQLTSLPILPAGLTSLEFGSNQIAVVPAIPSGVTYLGAMNNLFSSLPELPDTLYYLGLSGNVNLTCLPQLKKIANLYFVGTAINCLPNTGSIGYSNPDVTLYPLCDVLNGNGCQVYSNIFGRAYNDSVPDCLLNNGEKGLSNLKVKLYENGNLQQQTTTVKNGNYTFSTAYSSFQYTIDTVGLPFTFVCPDSGYHSSIITVSDSADTDKDFGYRCKAGFDLKAQSIIGRFQPGTTRRVAINAGDFSNFYGAGCAAGVSGTVQLLINGAVKYISADTNSLSPTSISNNTVSWNIPDFGALNFFTSFNCYIQTDTTAVIGSQVCFTLIVNPVNGDNNPLNNTLTQCFTIVGSCDPNEKLVSPEANIDTMQEWLTYTIHFQNTGTAEAIHVHIVDTLDTDLDASTFQLLAYSHQPSIQIKDRAVRFNFPNINLPDSNTNEPLSHGYVQYKIKLKESLPIGTTIHNTAFIYFDFNAPVVTNPTTNTITINTGISATATATANFYLYPNPTSNTVTVSIPEELIGSTLTITDLTGVRINTVLLSTISRQLSTESFSNGIYFVSIRKNGAVFSQKLVVSR